jgi:hypothetical protein
MRCTLWRGQPPPKQKKNLLSSVSIRRTGYVGAPATPGVMAHCGKEKKRRKPLDDGENLY